MTQNFDPNDNVVKMVRFGPVSGESPANNLGTDPAGNITIYSYDDNNNVIQTVEIELSQQPGVPTETFRTTLVYDTLDRLTRSTDNCNNTDRFAYDSCNNLTHNTDAKADATRGCSATPNTQGNSMRYVYDGLNRRLRTIQDLRVGERRTSLVYPNTRAPAACRRREFLDATD